MFSLCFAFRFSLFAFRFLLFTDPLKPIPLAKGMLNEPRQRKQHFLPSLYGVMEDDNSAGFEIIRRVTQALFRAYGMVVIHCEDRPEYEAEIIFENEVFPGCESAMGWSEQLAVEKIPAFHYIVIIASRRRFPSTKVVE